MKNPNGPSIEQIDDWNDAMSDQPAASMEGTPFELEAVYDEQIAPLMSCIIDICKRHNMPMVASFMFRHTDGDEGEDGYCTTSLGGVGDWQPDRFKTAVGVIRRQPGFAAFTVTRRK